MSTTVKSTLFNLKSVEKAATRALTSWVRQWERAGYVVVLKATFIAAASRSALSLLDSSTYWAKKSATEMI